MRATRIRSCVTRTLPITILLVLGSLLGACSNVAHPKVRHIGARTVELDQDRAVIALELEATNPNEEQLPLTQIKYRVFIGDEQVFAAVRSPELTLDTYTTRTFEVPCVLDRSRLSGGTIGYTFTGELIYKPPGRFASELYRSRVHVPTVEFTFAGSLDTSAVSD